MKKNNSCHMKAMECVVLATLHRRGVLPKRGNLPAICDGESCEAYCQRLLDRYTGSRWRRFKDYVNQVLCMKAE